jgi:hypothetical protein
MNKKKILGGLAGLALAGTLAGCETLIIESGPRYYPPRPDVIIVQRPPVVVYPAPCPPPVVFYPSPCPPRPQPIYLPYGYGGLPERHHPPRHHPRRR